MSQVMKHLIINTQLITETLPISSSSHVWLVSFLANTWVIQTSNFSNIMEGFISLPTLVVIGIFFAKPIWTLLHRFWKITRSWFAAPHSTSWLLIMCRIALYALAADICTFIVMLILKPLNGNFLIHAKNSSGYMALGLTITGLALASTSLWPNKNYQPLSLAKSIILGIIQAFAVFPGISRMGTTLVVMHFLKIHPRRAFQFSFIIYTAIALGQALKAFLSMEIDFVQFSTILTPQTMGLALLSCIISYFGLWLTSYLYRRQALWWFGAYLTIPVGIIIRYQLIR